MNKLAWTYPYRSLHQGSETEPYKGKDYPRDSFASYERSLHCQRSVIYSSTSEDKKVLLTFLTDNVFILSKDSFATAGEKFSLVDTKFSLEQTLWSLLQTIFFLYLIYYFWNRKFVADYILLNLFFGSLFIMSS